MHRAAVYNIWEGRGGFLWDKYLCTLNVSKLFIFCISGYRNGKIQKALLFECKLAFYTSNGSSRLSVSLYVRSSVLKFSQDWVISFF